MRAVERGAAELVHSTYWSTLIGEPCRRGRVGVGMGVGGEEGRVGVGVGGSGVEVDASNCGNAYI